MASLCLSYQDTKTDMQQDHVNMSHGHHVTLTWDQILNLAFKGQAISFKVTQQEKYDGAIAGFYIY